MLQPTLVQVVLLELAAAGTLCGLAAGAGWAPVGVLIGVLLLAAAVVPVHGRWLYRVVGSWLALQRRRAAVRGPGLQSLLGGFVLQTVPAGGRSEPFAVVRTGTSWALPLEITGDAAVPKKLLLTLLQVEDVPLASARVLTLAAAARLPRRFCLLTLDAATAGDAMAARGGSEAALQQILRRCVLRAEQVLASAGIAVVRLDLAALEALFDSCLGAAVLGGAAVGTGRESWRDVRVAGTWSTGYAAPAAGADQLSLLVAGSRIPLAATCVVARRTGPRGEPTTTAYLRLTGPGAARDLGALDAVLDRARGAGLRLRRLDGEQAPVLAATIPVAVPG